MWRLCYCSLAHVGQFRTATSSHWNTMQHHKKQCALPNTNKMDLVKNLNWAIRCVVSVLPEIHPLVTMNVPSNISWQFIYWLLKYLSLDKVANQLIDQRFVCIWLKDQPILLKMLKIANLIIRVFHCCFYRYGKIVSTKAILDKNTNQCKGEWESLTSSSYLLRLFVILQSHSFLCEICLENISRGLMILCRWIST